MLARSTSLQRAAQQQSHMYSNQSSSRGHGYGLISRLELHLTEPAEVAMVDYNKFAHMKQPWSDWEFYDYK